MKWEICAVTSGGRKSQKSSEKKLNGSETPGVLTSEVPSGADCPRDHHRKPDFSLERHQQRSWMKIGMKNMRTIFGVRIGGKEREATEM